MRKKIQQPEAAIQKVILHYLALRKIPAWRMNSGAYKSITGTFIRYGNKGMADIIAILPPDGRWLAIEVKSEKGYLTEAQRDFALTIEKAGGISMVARSVEDVCKYIVNRQSPLIKKGLLKYPATP